MPPPTDFEALHQAYARELFCYLWRLLDGSSEAEDCLQETFLRALRAYPRLRSHRNLRAWLYRVATNTARTYFRRQAQEQARTTHLDREMPEPGLSLSDDYDQEQTLTTLRAAVRKLPHKQRAALWMRKYQGLEYSEIALALECSPATARANVYQALAHLRRTFANSADEENHTP